MAETKMQLADWLDDLCVRFIVNLPQEELESAERICFQVEEAQWFYEDFIRPLDPSLPSMSLRTFCMAIFKVCPLLSTFSAEHHLAAYSQFLAYKTRVPVRGAILLNDNMDQVLLVKGWKKGASWSFPRGKINKDEKDLDCAVREVYEETGYDLVTAGLVPNGESMKSVEVTMREQHMKLYIFRNVPLGTAFQARTRKEISKILWWKLSQLPGFNKKKPKLQNSNADESGDSVRANKLYMVAPFLPQLKKWISQQRRMDSHRRTTSDTYLSTGDMQATDADLVLEDDLPSDVPAQNLAPMAYDFSTALPQMVSHSSAGSLPQGVPADASAQMKRMLGISSPEPQSHPPPKADASGLPQHQTGLLDILRQRNLPQNSALPAHPVTQGDVGDRETSRTEYNVSRHPHSISAHNSMAPNIPTSRSKSGADLSLNTTSVSPGSQPFTDDHPQGRFQGLPGHAQQQYQQELHQNSQSHFPLSSDVTTDRSNANFGPPSSSHVSGLTNRSQLPISTQQPPSIPEASELPMPRLSDHAMQLLNMFKTPSKHSTTGAKTSSAELSSTQPILPPTDRRTSGSQSRPQTAQSGHSSPAPRRSSAKLAFGGLIPNSVSPSLGANGRPQTPARKNSEVDSRQAKLPNLFKNSAPEQLSEASLPSEPSVTPKQVQQANTQQSPTLLTLFKSKDVAESSPRSTAPLDKPDAPSGNSSALLQLLKQPAAPTLEQRAPVASHSQVPQSSTSGALKTQDLAGQMSTGGPAHEKVHQTPTASIGNTPKPRQTLPKPPTAASQTSNSTSKNVFGEPASAETSQPPAARKRKQAPRTALQKAEKKAAAPAPPVQILKRPQGSSAAQPAPQEPRRQPLPTMPQTVSTLPTQSAKPPQPVSPVETPKQSPKKPFAPQILQRPKPDNSAASNQPATAPATRTPSSKDDQQRALLALLSSAGRSSNSTPVSPSTRTELSRSRIGSVASPPIDGGRSKLGSATSESRPDMRVATPSGKKKASVEKKEREEEPEPISPADKGFLVSYLEGVIGGKAAK
ncbi:MAG: hypothetical protein Q9159_006170 [Coniocarpon cinnabarinum]